MEHADVSREDLIRIIKQFEGYFYIGHIDMQVYVKLRIPLGIRPEHSSVYKDCLDSSFCSNLITELRKLFKKYSYIKVSQLPKICKFYNVKEGCRKPRDACQYMHICQPFIRGTGTVSAWCRRNHDIFEPSVTAVLEMHGVNMQLPEKTILAGLRDALDFEDLGAASHCDVLETPTDGGRDRDMTYAWQIRESGQEVWLDVDGDMNAELESTYSDPDNSVFSAKLQGEMVLLNFRTMSGTTTEGRQNKMYDVRRLSTISAGQVEGLPLTTEWRWYWLNHTGQWMEYGKGDQSDCNYKSNLSSFDMEQKYLDNPDGQIEFVTSENGYNLDFRRMLQTNKRHKTERKVCRRPVFVNSDDMNKLKEASRAVPLKKPDDRNLPKHWTIQGGVDALEHVKQVHVTQHDLQTMKEYTDIETLFFKSMPQTVSITSIHRVENGDLWLNYASKQEKMKKNNRGKDIDERRLFHGTQTSSADAICHKGFDFRLSGTSSGTVYGKGSYFALNAKFSDSYTETSKQVMFVVKVLVGDFVKGIPSYARPPLKDPSDIGSALYDSCVNDEKDPSIFVIFEFNQVYPEYLIRYNI